MNTVTVQDIPVAYEEAGAGPPMLLIHGWGSDHHYMMADLEPALTNDGTWRRVYVDLPGHGQTPAPDWLSTQTQVLSILTGFIDSVFGNQTFAVVGSSYGGYLSLALVRSMPKRLLGAALLVPDLPAADNTRDVTERIVLVEEAEAFADLTEGERWIPDVLVEQSRRAVEQIREHEMDAIRASDGAFLRRLNEHYVLGDEAGRPGLPFDKPSLIALGRQDSTVGYRSQLELIEEFPRATFAVCDLAGHWLGRIERPALFRSLVTDWLDRMRISMTHP